MAVVADLDSGQYNPWFRQVAAPGYPALVRFRLGQRAVCQITGTT